MNRLKLVGGSLAAVAVLGLAACRSSKQATTPHGGAEGTTEWVDKMAAAAVKDGTVTSKMDFEVAVDGKSLSVGGNCNLKRGEMVQLSLVALGLMEVGRLEFTPQYAMMVNRLEREYVKVDYADVPFLARAGVDFHALEALFWNDLFVPGKAAWQAQDFAVEQADGYSVMTSEGGLLRCRFVVDLLTGLIRTTSAGASGGSSASPALTWDYQHFANVDGKSFPDKMQLSVKAEGKSLTASFSLRNPKWNAKDVEPTKEPGGRYKQVSAESILKKLLK